MGKYGTDGQDKDGSKIGPMHFAFWINKATRSHARSCVSNTDSFSTATVVSGTRLMLRYTYGACFVQFSGTQRCFYFHFYDSLSCLAFRHYFIVGTVTGELGYGLLECWAT